MRLSNKVAIVTGAASGIGKAIALAFASEGALVTICDVNAPSLAEVEGELRTLGGRAFSAPVDVAEGEQVKAMVDTVARTWGTVDILVNNAGGGGPTAGLEVTEAEWDEVLEL